ncbi:MAG TPA: flagellar FliJ family protein [Polyangiaceae bacterium]|jgi:flagellar export protein FliJ|nr:flagellar FliJ family protein [Polyangiaceae bacterium]
MNSRNKRLRLLSEQRQRQLDDRVAELHECQRLEALAETEEQRASDSLAAAQLKRQSAATSGIESGLWTELNHWLEAVSAALLAARKRTFESKQKTLAAKQRVLAARAELKQIETLAERFKQRELALEAKAEQRLTDEHTQLTFARRRGTT